MTLTLERVEKTLQKAPDLPTLSSVAMTVTQMIQAPNVSAAEIGTIISDDQVLTARVLRVVNSAYYGFPQQINNITHAIVILGFNKVRDVVLTTSVLDAFRGKTSDFPYGEFWEHCIAAAIASDSLARTIRSASEEDAFVAGLLHDIGKLVLALYFPDEFGEMLRLAREKRILLREAESELSECDHTAVGRILAANWGFTEALTEAVYRHHSPASSRKHKEVASIVHVGDILARALLVGSGGDNRIPALNPTVRENLKLSREILDRAIGETIAGLLRGRVFFDLIKGTEGKPQ